MTYNNNIILEIEKLCLSIESSAQSKLTFYTGISDIADFDTEYTIFQNKTITSETLKGLSDCGCFGCNPVREEIIIGNCESLDSIDI